MPKYMQKIINSINHQLSQNIINKTTTVEDWFKKELKQSYKEVKGFWYEKEYK